MFSLILVPFFIWYMFAKAVTVQEGIEAIWMSIKLDSIMLGIGLVILIATHFE